MELLRLVLFSKTNRFYWSPHLFCVILHLRNVACSSLYLLNIEMFSCNGIHVSFILKYDKDIIVQYAMHMVISCRTRYNILVDMMFLIIIIPKLVQFVHSLFWKVLFMFWCQASPQAFLKVEVPSCDSKIITTLKL